VEYLKDPLGYAAKDERLAAQAKRFTLPMQRFDKLPPEDLAAIAESRALDAVDRGYESSLAAGFGLPRLRGKAKPAESVAGCASDRKCGRNG
jgi:hypothetical protein